MSLEHSIFDANGEWAMFYVRWRVRGRVWELWFGRGIEMAGQVAGFGAGVAALKHPWTRSCAAARVSRGVCLRKGLRLRAGQSAVVFPRRPAEHGADPCTSTKTQPHRYHHVILIERRFFLSLQPFRQSANRGGRDWRWVAVEPSGRSKGTSKRRAGEAPAA